MGVCSNAKTCFGINLNDGLNMPWDEEDLKDSYQDWWKRICPGIPIPFELVRTFDLETSKDCIIAVPGTILWAHRGWVTEFDPITAFQTPPDEAMKAFNDFIEHYLPAFAGQQPKWFLCSYWS